MDSAQAALDRLCDPQAEVSAHYLIGNDGMLWQMVAEGNRAWHAGAGEWHGQGDINSRSIGIELDNRGTHPFSQPQMTRLEKLLADIMTRWDIPPEGVIGHSDMAPGRKFDPGSRFDWERLARLGLAQARGRQGNTEVPFREAARAVGFTAPVDDETLLAGVRLRFRPWGIGPLCQDDLLALPPA